MAPGLRRPAECYKLNTTRHYLLDIKALETPTNVVIHTEVKTGEQLEDGAYARINRGGVVGETHGVAVELPRAGSATVYFDVIDKDGEIVRYVVELERTDV